MLRVQQQECCELERGLQQALQLGQVSTQTYIYCV